MGKLTCFKAYDIRGRLGDELNVDIVYRIGRAFGQFLKPKTIVVGGDVRLTSKELKSAVTNGLLDSGVNVIDLGETGTEEVYFATSFLNADGGIEVTASHNPMDYNGLKLVREGSRPISADTGLADIQRLAEENHFPPVVQRGEYKQLSVLGDYVEHLLSYINVDNLKPMKLVINSGNGAAGHVIDAIEAQFRAKRVPVEFIKIHNNPDGTFPNGIPNPILPDNRQDTIDTVLTYQADMGIAFDGDFDRCFLFDENGGFIEGYYIVGLLSQAFLQKNKGAKIIYDPRLIWNTVKLVEENGGEAVMSKSGHSFIKEKMRAVDAIYGGEMSAHHYFRDFFYCDSGMIPWLLVMELVSTTGKSLGELVNESINTFPSPGEINSKLVDAQAAIARVRAAYEENAISVNEIDGISIEYPNWRFNLRTSNTEPVVRLNLETRGDRKLMLEKTEEILALLRQ
ncbi:phosphomannomutase/phosphoglucomutase [Avibacterium paragallinarum]|uniref:phosphomannomutase/phosphoglucomutase n=1 Tax=Avibacterium paragallinarum TaxID=728 RepID=UPI00021AD1F4|nr:phosphomannomutase/phosphoglucomutase [Avibacterium paragallinarum]AZI13212.1 phosphomannomutase/phosphoglucomutase [Avibacterium paragallinarum]QIR12723.1 phosphomannomutase/phosphoglucomutase [Avibacterium paragallinarum]QJE10393.1 phosphomannomutase/phosphoglucomutase [Avibacterium paragallinarum]QJE12585.1 phosphomannomutase/phosphoglucomutase [Avibacterium paragallinarum]QJE14789.1 phosphomannomutase/phosphoglucomutase [Avibacterium paragallinarum]